MKTDRIDFISEYCDRWCERCAFTSRCSAFAARVAIAMCGDVQQGIELAVGAPHPVGRDPDPPPAWLAELADFELSPDEEARIGREEEERQARVDAASIVTMEEAIAGLAREWLTARYETLRRCADPVLCDALETALHDATFIGAKLARALHGRDWHQHEEDDEDEHPVQNDWNGSAKVALISIERSETAWRVIAQGTGEDLPAALADSLVDLRRQVEREFPDAWSFARPGFDDADR